MKKKHDDFIKNMPKPWKNTKSSKKLEKHAE